jgi:tRNA (guanine10-N2)-methyltransferase
MVRSTMNIATSDRTLGSAATETTTNDSKEASQPLPQEICCNLFDAKKYYVLVEFAVRHLDFQIPELVSVLHMNQIDVLNYNDTDAHTKGIASTKNKKTDSTCCSCTLVPLPNDDLYSSHRYKTYSKQSPTTTPPMMMNDIRQNHPRDYDSTSTRPFVILSMDYDSPLVPLDAKENSNDVAQNENRAGGMDIASIILSRCTLVRSVIELWGMATSIKECVFMTKHQCGITNDTSTATTTTTNSNNDNESLLSTFPNNVRNKLYQIQSVPSKSWKMTIHTLGSTYTREEQDDMRQEFTKQIPLLGRVQMQDPNNEFVVLREIELDPNGGPKLQQQQNHSMFLDDNPTESNIESSKSHPNLNDSTNNTHNNNTDNHNCHGQYPSIACYFGRALGGCRSTRRMGGNIPKYDLKQRKYLGPTSMDAELSFIMTNLGQVQNGQMVFDPFVGTGSILLSCATRGAYCVGTDIDIRVLRGRSPEENIFSNFRQFHLPRPELIRSDNGIYHRHFRPSHPPIYNAIVCDPPYGIRAGARKSGSKRDHVAPVKPENRHDHIAQTQTYDVSDVLADLVDVASRTLVMFGWLVYVIPSFATSFEVEVDLPQHPCLELVHVCYQPLSSELGRRIVAMRKVGDYDETKRDEFIKAAWKNGPESADKCANIRAKIIELAKTKPRYTERAAIRKEKRRVHREEKKVAKQKMKLML